MACAGLRFAFSAVWLFLPRSCFLCVCGFVSSSPGFVFSVFVVLFAGLPVGVPCLVAFCPLPARFQPVGACLPCLLVFWWLCLAVGSACVGVGAKLLGGGALCRGCAGCGFGLACCGGRCCAFGVVLVLRCARRACRWVRGGGAAVFGALCGPWLGRVVWSGRRSAALFLFALAFRCACVYSMRPGGLKFSGGSFCRRCAIFPRATDCRVSTSAAPNLVGALFVSLVPGCLARI